MRIAIVGLEFGSKVLLPSFRNAGCEVVALCGTNLEKTQKFAKELEVPHAFADYRQMLSQTQLDAIVISAPPGPQVEIAEAALKRGLHVFAEKPLGISPAQTAGLVSLAQNKTTMVDFEFVDIDVWKRAKELIGPNPSNLKVTWHVMTYIAQHFMESWKRDPARGGGALHVFGSHVFYNLEWFNGPIRELSAKLFKHAADPRDTHTGFSLDVAFVNGSRANVHVDTRFEGEAVHAWEWEKIRIENRGADYVKDWRLFENGVCTHQLPPQSVDGRILAVTSMAKRFVSAIEQGNPLKPSFEDGHRVQQLIACAFDSMKKGGSVIVS